MIDPRPVGVLLTAIWAGLAVLFARRRRGAAASGQPAYFSPLGRIGFGIQAVAFAALLGGALLRRHAILDGTARLGSARAVLVVVLAGSSIPLVLGALRALGRHWALDARTLEGHRLVREGPYARVRHPIYTGMGALVLATGLAVGHWPSLGVSLVLYVVGTALRVAGEDGLLRSAFGPAFESYRARVPAVLPRIGGPPVAESPASVSEFLKGRRLAVAGVSRDSRQTANAVFRKLRDSGYEVFPVNPRTSEVEGVPCFPDVRSVPAPLDGVIIVTPPQAAAEVVRHCAEAGVKQVWFHRAFGQGSVSEEALRECRDRGIRAIPAGCPFMYCPPVDVAHRCMRGWLTWRGRLPKQ